MADFRYSALGSDHDYSGKIDTYTAGENLTIGQVGYMKDDGKIWLADSDSAATMPGMFLATGTINAEATGIFLENGEMRDDSWAYTKGGMLYVHTTGGIPTQVRPSGVGDQIQSLGIAGELATLVKFRPMSVLVEIKA